MSHVSIYFQDNATVRRYKLLRKMVLFRFEPQAI